MALPVAAYARAVPEELAGDRAFLRVGDDTSMCPGQRTAGPLPGRIADNLANSPGRRHSAGRDAKRWVQVSQSEILFEMRLNRRKQ